MYRKYLLAVWMGLLVGVAVNGGILMIKGWRVAAAEVVTVTSRSDWESGSYDRNKFDTVSTVGSLGLKGGSVGSFGDLAALPNTTTSGAGGAYVSGANAIYMTRGGGRSFWKYDVGLDLWSTLPDTPYDVGIGGGLVYDGNDSLYLLRGGTTTGFYKFSISSTSWSTLEPAPATVLRGAIAFNNQNGKVYVARGSSDSKFWEYDPSTNGWTTLTPLPAIENGSGGLDLTYVNGKIYYQRHGYSYGAVGESVYEYNPSTNAWTTKTASNRWSLSQSGSVTDGTDIYVIQGSTTAVLRKYSVGTSTWSNLTSAPGNFTDAGGTIITDGTYIYGFQGGTTSFWRYAIATNIWSSVTPASLPVAENSVGGIDLTYVNGKIYYQRHGYTWGAVSESVYEYNPNANAWTTKAASNRWSLSQSGSTTDGIDIYTIQGYSTAVFRKYSVGTSAWSDLASAPGNFADVGGAIGTNGTDVYAFQGGTTAFWKYTIAANTWLSSSTLPFTPSYGAGLAYGTTAVAMFATAGNGRSFYKYDLGTTTWSTLADIPYDIGTGSKLEYDGSDSIYLLQGGGGTGLYRYSISGNSWAVLANVPLSSTRGSMTYDPINQKLYIARGSGDSVWWVYSVPTTNYSTQATWVKTHDLTYVTSWNSFSMVGTSAAGNNVSVATRVSVDNQNWSSWSDVSGGNIQSATSQRYLQVKLSWTSDGVGAPNISSYSFSYDGDGTAPSNPTTIDAYSSNSLSIGLTSGESYTYANPYFSWSGATDAASGVLGYYVYFGSSASADPVSSGNYQITGSYQAREAMVFGSNYYLRIKTKDKAGNVSAAETLFTYGYNGVSPPSESVKTLEADFGLGTTSAVDIGSTTGIVKLGVGVSGKWFGLAMLPAVENSYGGVDLTYVNGKIYYQKHGATWGAESGAMYEYNSSTNAWATKTASNRWAMNQSGSATDGTDVYVIQGYSTGVFRKYSIGTTTWVTLTSAPGNFAYNGSVIGIGGSYAYAFQGGSTNFWRYNIGTTTWDTSRAAAPASTTSGAGMVYAASTNSIYALQGGGRSFWKYDVASDVWTTLPDIPYAVGTGSDLEYDGSDNVYAVIGGGSNGFYKYSINSNSWSALPVLPSTMTRGAMAIDTVNRRIYVARGSGSDVWYQYEIDIGEWTSALTTPSTVYNPAMEYDGNDTIYVVRGYGTRTFWKYTVSTNTWATLSDTPYSMYYGTDLAYDGSRYVYALRGNTSNKYFRYDTVNEAWETLTTTPTNVGAGGGLAYNEDNGKLYAVAGAGTTGFWEYDVGTTTWIVKNGPSGGIGNGGGIVYDGNGHLYAVRANDTTTLYKYDIGTTTWSSMAVAPASIRYGGGSVVTDGTNIWLARNYRTGSFYRYNIASNSWVTLDNVTMNMFYGAMVKAGNRIYVLGGEGRDGMAYFAVPDGGGYNYKGSWTSESLNLGNVYNWAGISASISSSSATRVVMETRSSADNVTWSNWTLTANPVNIGNTLYSYSIGSSVAKYFQIKTSLYSLDQLSTPILSDVTVDYYKDELAPPNPTSVTAASSVGSTRTMTTGNWLNSTTPYFNWSAADDGDGGSGVAGYYVYFGGDSSVDAVVGGALQTGTSYAPTLTSDGEYYLKIKSKDNASNVSDTDEVSFHYRLDTSAPNKPSSVAADPRSYTAVNNFTMFWTEASDTTNNATSSGLLNYKYKTGVGTGVFAADQTTTLSQVTGVTAYQDGVNTFYVKSTDAAGNESDYVETAYYYNGSAPSPPTNLEVGVSYNMANSFSFSWGLPLSYTGSISEYRYSVNSLPTATNYTATVGTSLAAGAYATIKGENVFYVVAVDEAGNVNYDAYSSVEFTADTSAPGIPQNVETFDNSIRATKQYKVGLTWDAPTDLGTGFAGYAIYASATATSCTSSFSSFTLAGTTAGTTYVVADIGGTALSSSTYYFCIKAYDSTNQYSAVSSTVSLLPTGRWLTAPDLLSGPTATVKTKSATITWTTSRVANSFVKYGTSSGNYGNEVGSSDQITPHSIKLSGLLPGTKYYYKAIWTDDDGNQGSSSEATFTTTAAPTVSNVVISDIGLYAAYVKFTINNASSAVLQYGKTISYGGSVSISTSTTESTYIQRLDNLEDGTTYHFRVVGKDEEGNEFVGDDYSFATLPIPEVSNVKIQQVRGAATATIRVTWKSNTEVTSVLSFYPEGRAEMTRDQIVLDLAIDHEMIVENLLDDTDYTVVVKGKDVAGNSVVASNNKFKTSTDLRSPLIADLRVEPTVVGVGEEARAQIAVFWNTDELATSQIEYGSGTGSDYPNKTQEDGKLNSNHVVTIPDLKPQSVYHLRIVTKDRVGNISYSYDNVVITPKATRAALDLVVESLSKSFGFFSNLGEVVK